MQRSAVRSTALVVAVLLAGLSLVGCSKKDSATSTTSTTEAPSTSTTTPDQQDNILVDKGIQSELVTVGCYTGSIDGIIGPKTDAAIIKFQEAKGLTPDGEFNTATADALSAASSAKVRVCVVATTTTAAKPSTTTTTFAPNDAPCTATALVDAVGGDPSTTVQQYVCSRAYAGAVFTGSPKGQLFQAVSGNWRPMDTAAVCNAPSTQVPVNVKQVGCTGNGN